MHSVRCDYSGWMTGRSNALGGDRAIVPQVFAEPLSRSSWERRSGIGSCMLIDNAPADRECACQRGYELISSDQPQCKVPCRGRQPT